MIWEYQVTNFSLLIEFQTKKVPYWMHSCDILTIPWHWNEFSAFHTSPLKLFEYMASDVPIIASDLPSIREILSNGDNAILAKQARIDVEKLHLEKTSTGHSGKNTVLD